MSVESDIRELFDKIRRLERTVATVAGGGESNTGANVGSGGVGPYSGKSGVQLQFRNINTVGGRLSVALDAPNNEIDIDIGTIDIDDLSDVNAGSPDDQDVLVWINGSSEWQPKPVSELGGSVNRYTFKRVGRLYACCPHRQTTSVTASRDMLYAFPWLQPNAQSYDRAYVETMTANRTNAVCRVGIYEDDGDVYPGDLVWDSGEISMSTLGIHYNTITETFGPGLFWIVLNSDADDADVIFRAIDYDYTGAVVLRVMGKNDTNLAQPGYMMITHSQTYGALPDPFPTSSPTESQANNIPLCLLRAA